MLVKNAMKMNDHPTHIDHSIGSDSEESSPLVDGLELGRRVSSGFYLLEFSKGLLQSGSVLGDEVITGAEVL
jgi:hypothetical protein